MASCVDMKRPFTNSFWLNFKHLIGVTPKCPKSGDFEQY